MHRAVRAARPLALRGLPLVQALEVDVRGGAAARARRQQRAARPGLICHVPAYSATPRAHWSAHSARQGLRALVSQSDASPGDFARRHAADRPHSIQLERGVDLTGQVRQLRTGSCMRRICVNMQASAWQQTCMWASTPRPQPPARAPWCWRSSGGGPASARRYAATRRA